MENYRDLAQQSVDCALEIDDYLLGRSKGFQRTKEFSELLKNYQLKDTDNALTIQDDNFYLSLWKAMKKDSQKELRKFPELALEMRLLRAELDNIENSGKNKLEELRSLFCDLSQESLHYAPISFKKYLAA